jgi:RNA binding exosome subunit
LLVVSRNPVKKRVDKSSPITSIWKKIRNNLDLNNLEYSQKMIRKRIETTMIFIGMVVEL